MQPCFSISFANFFTAKCNRLPSEEVWSTTFLWSINYSVTRDILGLWGIAWVSSSNTSPAWCIALHNCEYYSGASYESEVFSSSDHTKSLNADRIPRLLSIEKSFLPCSFGSYSSFGISTSNTAVIKLRIKRRTPICEYILNIIHICFLHKNIVQLSELITNNIRET